MNKFSPSLGSFPNPEPSESLPTTHKQRSKLFNPDTDLITERCTTKSWNGFSHRDNMLAGHHHPPSHRRSTSTGGIVAAVMRTWMASYGPFGGYPTHILELDQIRFPFFKEEEICTKSAVTSDEHDPLRVECVAEPVSADVPLREHSEHGNVFNADH